MEKELENYINLENQIEKIADLATKLKEENKQLKRQNEQLMIQSQSAERSHNQEADTNSGNSFDELMREGLSGTKSEIVRSRVKSALLKLDQLRQAVMEAN